MIVTKTLETTLNLSNPNDIYVKKFDELCIQKLTEKFENKCFNSCYILKILSIVKRSFRYMKETLDGGMLVDVKFEASVLIYQKDDIINNCRILKKESNSMVHACSDFAGVQFKQLKNYEIYNENDIIPVIVKNIRYNVNQNAITVSAYPFTPVTILKNHFNIFYKIKGTMSVDELEIIKKLSIRITNESSIIKNLKTSERNIYKFFNDLIYPYNKNYNYTEIFNATKNSLTLDNITSFSTGIVFLPLLKYLDAEFFSIKVENFNESKLLDQFKKIPGESNYQILEETPYIVFSYILNKHLRNLNTLKEFNDTYKTFAEVQKYKEVWKLYTMLKN
jgi:hypothetical protein